MKTGVEWLEEIYLTTGIDRNVHFNQAKLMECEQIIDAFEIGYENGACVNEGESIYHGHNYYNETFKSE